ncbi:D-alanyl-D-alanine carboxypeptidase [Erythrobacter mangrovi]|uniref:serine-type D-Ala-D-Ala carboxypeptidase n=2 Tax=Erythrobacter mangrovi TaxID=2739433 RepID=A0A7D4BXQ7_9SPHN|nr:D-alanyl-D-alanine carboxypeptidase [Erythrobacter mangrovi]
MPLGARSSNTPSIPSVEDAPIAYLFDATSGQVLFAREEDRRFMPASITKVMTTFLAFEWMEEGRLLPQQIFGVRPETFKAWSRVGSTMFLPPDARVTADDLLHGVTTVSANDGAVVLAEGAAGSVQDWIAAMNAKARELGMRDTYYGTPNGWMDEGRTFTSARDLALLAQAMISRHPAKYRHFVGAQTFRYNNITQRNHDPISGIVPGADGIKTGFTNQAGFGFLGSAERDGQRLIMVVAGSPTGRDRNKAARSFIEWGFASFDSLPLFPQGAQVTEARVQDGASPTVGLRGKGPISIVVPHDTKPRVSISVRYEGPLQAPVRAGEEVAELIVEIEGMPKARLPLVADGDVPKANAFQRLINGFRGWVT